MGTVRKQRLWKSGTTTGNMSIKRVKFFHRESEGEKWYLSEINPGYKIITPSLLPTTYVPIH